MKAYGNKFYGNEISLYGQKMGYVDYATLAKAFDCVLNNTIIGVGNFEPVSGDLEEDVYQWYIIDVRGVEILTEIGEIVWYSDDLDIYLWGVTHYGTLWDYVLTSIPIVSD